MRRRRTRRLVRKTKEVEAALLRFLVGEEEDFAEGGVGRIGR